MIVSCSNDVNSYNEIKKFGEYLDDIMTNVEFSSDRKMIVAFNNKITTIWDIQSGKLIKALFYNDYIMDVKILSNDQKILVATSTALKTIKSQQCGAVQFSTNGLNIVRYLDNTIELLDLISQTKVKKKDNSFESTKLKYFLSEQTILMCCKDNIIRLWDIKLGMKIQGFEGHSERIKGFDISSDGNIIVSFSDDKTIPLWKVI
ncbi:WD-40 repeat-containing protein [Reticulomyxa filosa]|uniref:WD-40 repeat-containing protein n=1 Tax=Reticulomyxa filosa TaxID=46433 RepID=X6PBT7_RETFI|nr:WD-40 repeat-containing protein [Reticulomyxa filosa]|eukprot:ETO35583.1 WD-40 repeat-containing protein [Reticulomyxa filosa]